MADSEYNKELWDLVEKFLQTADEGAAREIVSRLAPDIRGRLQPFYPSDSHGLDDAMQEIWARIFANLSRLKRRGNFKGWCLTVAMNFTINERNSAYKRRVKAWPPIALEGFVLEDPQRPDKTLEAREDELIVEKVLASLNTKDRQYVRMYYGDGMTVKQIALVTGENYSDSGFRKRIATALKRANECFKNLARGSK